MDEILIGEKKYISSKQAAKATGYAKDYIGQLCREGRVPARLVGRSWYVLESAIHDHRFGERIEQEKTARPASALSPTWESPRYEASPAETFPSLNRLQRPDAGVPLAPELPKRSEDDQNEVGQHLQDSWKAWFDRVGENEPVTPTGAISDVIPERQKQEKEEEQPDEVEESKEDSSVNVPIHAVYRKPPEELLPRRYLEVKPPSNPDFQEVQVQRGGRGTVRAIQITGAVLAVLAATVAVVGTGYFDEYILSNSQAGLIAGVLLYNK
jgi:hypothetical protein